jgi:hypothetical protein
MKMEVMIAHQRLGLAWNYSPGQSAIRTTEWH